MKQTIIILLTIIFLTVGCQENARQSNVTDTNRNLNRNFVERHADKKDPALLQLRGRANSILHRSLSSDIGLIRAHAIEVVSETGRDDLMPSVVKLLKDESLGVRFVATVTIGDMNYKPGALAVKPILRDEDINAKIAAAYTLTRLKKENLDSLIIKHSKNPDPIIRSNAALLLGKLGKKDAYEHLKWILNDSESTYLVKIQAVEALAMLEVDKKTTYKRLWTLLVSKFADDKISGIKGMRLLDTKDSRAAIGTMLKDEIPEIRLFAAEQLGRLSDYRGKTEVIDYFENIRPSADDTIIEQADRLAAMAIGRIGGPELTKYLPMLLDSNNMDVQLRAAQAVLLLTN